jgi:REP element-mobilizing transposase RayT
MQLKAFRVENMDKLVSKKPHKDALWSPSYFAVSVGGAPVEVLKEYIKNQSRP